MNIAHKLGCQQAGM